MLFFCAVVACALTAVAAAPLRPSFPTAYQANVTLYTSMLNLTANGFLATSKALEARMINLTSSQSLILFKQHVFYTWGRFLCIKKALPDSFTYQNAGDPLQHIRLTSYAGVVRVRGVQTQAWLFQSTDLHVAIYVTDDARQTPVRLITGRPGGAAEQIDYMSFTAGSSPNYFQPPTCSAGMQQRSEPEADKLAVDEAASESLEETRGLAVLLHATLASMSEPEN